MFTKKSTTGNMNSEESQSRFHGNMNSEESQSICGVIFLIKRILSVKEKIKA